MGKYRVKAIRPGWFAGRVAERLEEELNYIEENDRVLRDFRFIDGGYVIISEKKLDMSYADEMIRMGRSMRPPNAESPNHEPPQKLQAVLQDWARSKERTPSNMRREACLQLFSHHRSLHGLTAMKLVELRDDLKKYMDVHDKTCSDRSECGMHALVVDALEALGAMPQAQLQ